MMTSASSADWRCWASKSGGTYSASIDGVVGNTFKSRTEPPDALASDTAVSIADLARSVSARSTGTRIFLNIVPPPVQRFFEFRIIDCAIQGHQFTSAVADVCRSPSTTPDRRRGPRRGG